MPGRRLTRRWTKPLNALVVVAVVVAGGLLLPGWTHVAPVEQPLVFNHAIHAKFNSTCDTCHQRYDTGLGAGRPVAAICAECHDPEDDPLGDSPEEKRLRAYLVDKREIPWRRLPALPIDVRFSHVLHVRAEITCERCHGDIGQTSTPPERPLVTLSMEDCMTCHEERGASNDCMACHR